jgi:hypothetical protein
MSAVADLRQALQDVVAPDLKAVVAGLNALRDEVRSGNSLLREDISLVRAETAAVEKRSAERLEKTEQRLVERVDRFHDAVKIADLTRRNAELEAAMEQFRKAQPPAEPQQH